MTAVRAPGPDVVSGLPAKAAGRWSSLFANVRSPWTLGAITAATVLVAGWQRRWTADDGLISVRVAEQIWHGHGPVVNAGERVEVSTSVLWPWLLAAFGWVPFDLAWVAVWLGLLFSALAILMSVMAIPGRGSQGVTWVPAGALVVVAVPAFWDFFTSGLETGLTFFWISAAWLTLVRTVDRPTPPMAAALLLGLGPLVRPELAVVTIVFMACWLVTQPRVRTWLVIVPLTLVPSVAYEVFRAGYYGVLVPNTAVTKEAGLSNWGQGLWYLGDLVAAYQLWLPLLASVVLLGAAFQQARRSERLIMLAPVLAALLTGAYVVRVGGDFMHARLLLPSLFCLLQPVFVVRWRTQALTAIPLLAIGVWAVASAMILRPAYSGTETFHGIVDERSQLSSLRHRAHVITVADQELTNDSMISAANQAAKQPFELVYVPYDGWRAGTFDAVPANPGLHHGVLAAHALGVTSHVAAERDLYVQDLLGLADPVTAHYRLEGSRGRPGHEKWLADAWIVARYASISTTAPRGVTASDVAAARAALSCGRMRELQASYRAKLTPRRFWLNLRGAFSRTSFRFDPDPAMAAQDLCAGGGRS